MRRLLLAACTLALLAAQGPFGAGAATATQGGPADDPARGLVYDGLRAGARNGSCPDNYELRDLRDRAGRVLCSHGPDPAPPGIDVRQPRPIDPVAAPGAAAATPAPGAGTAAAAAAVRCDGNGSSGNRVQLLYVHATNVSDRFASLTGNFQQWATNIDNAFSNSAAETAGDRHVRFVHDAGCNVIVDNVAVSSSGDDDFSNTLSELRSKGYTRSDRKYVAFVDASKYCGIAQVYYDDRPTPDNASNGVPSVEGELARVDAGCWDQSNSVAAHELMHTLGGVQTSAPHATANNHCTDEYDRMCYNDGAGVTLSYPCASSHEALFDCNHDDYFHTGPRAGSYLATHWNTANSSFLIGAGTTGTTTTTTTSPPPSTTTTTAPPGTTTTTIIPPATTTTTRPPTGGVPSAPPTLSASMPSSGTGIVLSWSPPASNGGSPITGYRIYRGTNPSALTLLTSVGPSTAYADTATVRNGLYYYQVTAVNAVGEGPRSPYARMVAR